MALFIRGLLLIYCGERMNHREGISVGFSKQYGCKILVWYSFFETMTDAIRAEKLLKMKSRSYKIKLIESFNLSWSDLYEHVHHQ